ncbi:MAG: hypothetical protein M3N13_09430, partial [Candidatus Eremiobacteraeota bacterium]|nr:hypothetical protein [Candidatus Eremiobacteraeota bacterium]
SDPLVTGKVLPRGRSAVRAQARRAFTREGPGAKMSEYTRPIASGPGQGSPGSRFYSEGRTWQLKRIASNAKPSVK